MSDTESSVRLNLQAAGFLGALRELEKHSKQFGDAVEGVGDSAAKASRKTSALTSSMKTGFGAAKQSLADLGSQMKNTLSQAGTLGGALSVGAGMHGAQALVGTYKDIAFAIEAGTGAAQNWRTVQADVEATADRWSQKNEKVAESFKALYDDVGDVGYAKAGMNEVAKAVTAGAGSFAALTSVAGALNEKFGITSTELPDAMAAAIAAANKGGVGMDEFGAAIGNVGAAAKAVGIQGPEGFKRIAGMMNFAEGATKSLGGGLKSVSALLLDLADPDKIKQLEKITGLKLTDKKGQIKKDVTEQLLVKTQGKEQDLAKLFSGQQLGVMNAFGKVFQQARDETTGTAAQKNKAGLAAFNAAIQDASKQTLSANRLQEQATERLKDPARRLDDAMNRFTKAFEKPEVIEAIDKIAEKMPKLASVLGDVVGFAADHPMLAGAALVGGRPALAGLTSAGGDLAGSALKGAGSAIWKQAGTEFAASAAASGKWSAAGSLMAKTAGVAIAAYIAYEIGKAGIDKLAEGDEKNASSLAVARGSAGAALASKDPKKIAAAKEELEASIATAKKGETGVTGTLKRGFRGAAGFFGGTPIDQQENAIAKAEADLRELNAAGGGKGGSGAGGTKATGEGLVALNKGLQTGGKASEKAAGSMERAASAAERLAKTLDRASNTGGAGTNGLPPTPGSGSGSGAG